MCNLVSLMPPTSDVYVSRSGLDGEDLAYQCSVDALGLLDNSQDNYRETSAFLQTTPLFENLSSRPA